MPADANTSIMKRKRDDGQYGHGSKLERLIGAVANGQSKSSARNPHLTQTTQKSTADGELEHQQSNSSKDQHDDTLQYDPLALPIKSHKQQILTALQTHPVLILSGETGSGKSTQLPQYLLDDSSITSGLRIAVTQPRRVAAISLARRVASELHSPLGAGSKARVGYYVRFDASVGRANEIVYLTEGMLLQEMLHNPGFTKYGVVVVDEVHERGVGVDLLLGFLKELLEGKGQGARARRKLGLGRLRVVVMSATADVQALEAYFGTSGKTVEGNIAPRISGTHRTDESVAVVHVKGRQFPVEIIYTTSAVQDFTEAALECILKVHCKEPLPGDMLVFLTGQETIQDLQRSLEEYAQSLDRTYPKLLVLPIYAALSQTAQQRVFEPTPPNTRKVILATNIAETSITVPGVRFVIDSGKEKRKQFRPRLGLESLLVKPISKSSALQRAGRAGREAAGKCFRLYTKKDFDAFEDAHAPEIMRCDLADAVLKIKAIGVVDVLGFPLLTPPSREALARSLLSLHQLTALDDDGNITAPGRHMSRFPLTPSYGCVLLTASEMSPDCLLACIDIISCFSADNTMFLSADSEEQREEATLARASLLRRQGDHITTLAVVQGYATENTDRKAWCSQRKINHRAMQAVMDIRKQLRTQCTHMRVLAGQDCTDYDGRNDASLSEPAWADILRCFLKGFRHNIARLVPDGSYRTLLGNQAVAIHPSSVLFGRKVEAVVYNEFVFTNKTYARGVSAVQGNWIDDALG